MDKDDDSDEGDVPSYMRPTRSIKQKSKNNTSASRRLSKIAKGHPDSWVSPPEDMVRKVQTTGARARKIAALGGGHLSRSKTAAGDGLMDGMGNTESCPAGEANAPARFKANRTKLNPPLDHMDALKAVPLFKNCTTEFLEILAEQVVSKVFAGGSEILRQGDFGDCMYILHIGEVDVLVGETPVAVLGSGSVFGEMAAICKDPVAARRNATIRARSFCDCRVIGRSGLMRTLTLFPEDAAVIEVERQSRFADLKSKGVISKGTERSWCRPVSQMSILPPGESNGDPASQERRPTALWKQALGVIGLAKVLSSDTAKDGSRRASSYRDQALPRRTSATDTRSLLSLRHLDQVKKDRRSAGCDGTECRSNRLQSFVKQKTSEALIEASAPIAATNGRQWSADSAGSAGSFGASSADSSDGQAKRASTLPPQQTLKAKPLDRIMGVVCNQDGKVSYPNIEESDLENWRSSSPLRDEEDMAFKFSGDYEADEAELPWKPYQDFEQDAFGDEHLEGPMQALPGPSASTWRSAPILSSTGEPTTPGPPQLPGSPYSTLVRPIVLSPKSSGSSSRPQLGSFASTREPEPWALDKSASSAPPSPRLSFNEGGPLRATTAPGQMQSPLSTPRVKRSDKVARHAAATAATAAMRVSSVPAAHRQVDTKRLTKPTVNSVSRQRGAYSSIQGWLRSQQKRLEQDDSFPHR